MVVVISKQIDEDGYYIDFLTISINMENALFPHNIKLKI